MKYFKTPISYYGGKQGMLGDIIPIIPPHKLYAEPFCGGAAVFFAKEPASIEVISDTNEEVVNFYNVLKTNYEELKNKIELTVHSRQTFDDSKVIYSNPHLFNELERAYAFWVQVSFAYGSSPGTTMSFSKTQKNATAIRLVNKKNAFLPSMQKRLENCTIENQDALRIIERYDTEDSFFYIDPPYFNADMGHYRGYTESNFRDLLECISTIKGKFMLSSYESPLLTSFVEKHGWHQKLHDKPLSMSKGKRKIESISTNYPI